ncbi:hypothetical protein [Priestia megaterium]|uniref:hypothetical protein n=1 Tax=Priestia megaterium TaxID=1404 RepID=UPI000AA7EA40|nr:hypothetical protein [Priestia megaterium]MCI4621291.1 hypothetical protein [Priestia megaterium]
MKGNFQARFLGELGAAMPLAYPTKLAKEISSFLFDILIGVAARRLSSPLPFCHVNYTCSLCIFIKPYLYHTVGKHS